MTSKLGPSHPKSSYPQPTFMKIRSLDFGPWPIQTKSSIHLLSTTPTKKEKKKKERGDNLQ